MLEVDYKFSGIADAVEPEGFRILCKKAVSFLASHYGCDANIDLASLERGRISWAELGSPLPLEIYKPAKRDRLAIATLIEALSKIDFVSYSAQKSDNAPLILAFPAQVTALVMGIILYDVVLRTRLNPSVEVKYIDLDRIAGPDMQKAVAALQDGRSRKHKFRRLLRILEMFSSPIVFH